MPVPIWIRALLQRRRANRELEEEMLFHLQMEIEANQRRGLSPAAARQAALAAFGGVVQARELVHEVRTMTIESVWQDVKHAIRSIVAHRGFALTAAGMLALAIAITTTMFTIVDSLLLRPVPFNHPEQLAHLWMGNEHGGRTVVSPAVIREWRQSPAFSGVEAAMPATALIETGQSIAVRDMAVVTRGVFDLLGDVRPVRGRLFDASGSIGPSDQVVISETLWRTLYGGDPDLVGRTMVVNGERLLVIGILPEDFRFPSATTVVWRPTDLAGKPEERTRAYVRFASGLPREEALRLATEAARAADPVNASLRAKAFSLTEKDDYFSRAVPMLAGGVGLVFLVLCANVCGLLLARVTTRRREFSMRAALGASRARLMRQAIAEIGVLGAVGVVLGAVLAWTLVSIARALLPDAILLQTPCPLSLNLRALMAASVAGVLAILFSGLLPAWLGTQHDAVESLRIVDRGGTEARPARALMRALIVVEVAFACTLLIGATLLTRTFVKLASAERGLVTSDITMLWLAFAGKASTDPAAKSAVTHAVEDELRQLPGVQRLAWSYGIPPGGGMTSFGDWVSDAMPSRPLNLVADRYVVGPDFFDLYEIPIFKGRTFAKDDPFTNVIISDEFAKLLWPSADPLGRTFRFEKESFQVVGVAREIHLPAIDQRLDHPEFYHPYKTVASTPMLSVRCIPRCPDIGVIRYRLASAHLGIEVQAARPVDREYARQLTRPRASAALAATFAGVALIAAAGGLFSVLSYAVMRRRREFGIRTALGASRRQIRKLVLGDAFVVGVMGLLLGSIFAVWLGRALGSLQYGISPADPITWIAVPVLLMVTVAVASWIPARTAARLDPLVLLRED
jgi:predicted permease